MASRDERERLDRVFGKVLPDATRDERNDGAGETDDELASERELRRNVPPHHGQA